MTTKSFAWAFAGMLAAGTAAAQDTDVLRADGPEVLLTDGSPVILLDRLVVTAGEPKVAADTPQAVSVVDQEDFDSQQPSTIGDVLNDLPGVKAIGSGQPLGESFNIRGWGNFASSDEYRMIVNVDGAAKYYEQYRMGSLFTDPDLYKRAEVLRGPASSTLHGSGALAGVINLETKDPADFLRPGETFTFREKLEGHQNQDGFLTSSIAAAEPIENLQLLGAFTYRRSSAYKDGAGNEPPGGGFETPSALVKGNYAFGAGKAQKLRASYQYWVSDEKGQQFDQTGGSTGFGYVDRKVVDKTAIIGYSYAPTNNRLVDADISISYTDSANEQRNATNPSGSGSDIYDDVNYSYETWQLNVENTAELSGENFENFLIFGVDANYHTRTGENLEDSDGKVTIQPGGVARSVGFYIQNEWIYDERLTLIPGIRVDYQLARPDDYVTATRDKSTNTAISPKLAAHYKLNQNYSVFGSVAYTERLPVIDELYDNSDANADLKPEEAMNYELGFAMSFDDVLEDKDKAVAKVTTFLTDARKLIDDDYGINDNIDRAKIMGVEVEGAYDAGWLFGRLAYSFIRGEDVNTNESLNSIPADELVLTVGGRLQQHNLEYGWRGVFARHQYKTSNFGDPTAGYVVHDLFASWKPDDGWFQDGEVRFGIENVTDKVYREHLYNNNSAGRTFKLTVAKQF
ncbi:MAG: TonB-dependent receptor [Rhodospirillales bacterium]|nr:TonB-dependent receptor [Rhodospirillales bacterium]MBO6785704.1 TonB-dependent receptor [Rhodospirillales bacterium]